MKVIPPITITDSILTSSTVAEPAAGETAWNAATSYTVGQKVIRTTTHKVYQNLIAGIDAGLPESTPNRWLDVGYTERWRMFDLLRNTDTSSTSSPLTVVLTPAIRVNSIALLGIVADSVTISMTSGGSNVYSKTINLITRNTIDWSDYFYGVFGNIPAIVQTDLPPYSNGVITVSFTRASGAIKCAGLVLGTFVDLGSTEANAESDVINFSTITRDSFGTATLVPKRSIPKTIQNCLLDKVAVNKVSDVRDTLNAVPAVWFGVDDSTDGYFSSLLILGIYKRFTINMAHPEHAIVSLEIEEI